MKKQKKMYRGMDVLRDRNNEQKRYRITTPTLSARNDDKKKSYYGFTLIEMSITITLIIILSAICVPIYKSHALDAKRSEGYALLGVIREAQTQYFMEYRTFLQGASSSIKSNNWSCNEEVLEIDARANKYFTKFYLGNAGAYSFQSIVASKDAGLLTLTFNKTTGATFKI